MSSSSDQERHEADTGGSPDVEDRRSHPFNDVVVKYEWFMSRKKAVDSGDKATTICRSEVTGSSTSGHVEARRDQGEPAEVSTSGDHDENEGAVAGIEVVDDPSLAVLDFSFLSSVIKMEDL
ncbi:hypothetical protein ACOSP7_010138 [Xanthoceras sorbifolium]